jgi:hypothetical protein
MALQSSPGISPSFGHPVTKTRSWRKHSKRAGTLRPRRAPIRAKTNMTQSNNPFQVHSDFKHNIPQTQGSGEEEIEQRKQILANTRRKQAHDIFVYRRNRKRLELPTLRKDSESDQYQIKKDGQDVYFTPVFKVTQGIGSHRGIDTKWRASVGIVHPATRNHPEEGDEVELCDGRNLIEAVICAIAHVQLEEAGRIVEGYEIDRSIRRGEFVY